MNIRDLATCTASALLLLSAAACTMTKPTAATDLNAGLEVAAALETAYAARPSADPKVVADLTGLLASAQAAVASWEASNSPADQGLASAAISALVAYEAAAHLTP